MATDLENMTAALSGARAKLAAALTADYSSAEEFKPDFNGANSLDRVSYMRELREQITFLEKQLSSLDVFEITSEMIP